MLRVLNEEQSPSPTTFTPRVRSHVGNDIMLLDDTSPSGREIMVKIKCHGIVNKYKINEVSVNYLSRVHYHKVKNVVSI